ncbi:MULTISPECIES: DEAD/DEAH box helicase [Morganellaceae]|uniref:DEAD/DEAH box helicase n=1 Tax=Providencia alcalifaciens 205/92 TaxID=1256988 RepID=A0AAV3M6P6_9GAMM|nr:MULTISPECIES: DEAD/DEAH box helicase [Morganellaceae]EUD11413.1 DEAD/DEAH box helicase [Providencia alcalifaciens 205/92]MDK6973340.1 DEAD/DEAH box helicase [Proteus mirabilis]MTC27673.1 DEAD/DEAH box helicase [Providencia alcalifaciens]MTC65201.1 DEAD/DEAH box helicase [Providencia alcalifaciens]WGZ54772.1 DEAD/DEAH box helicase [Providencia alcalifaciens]
MFDPETASLLRSAPEFPDLVPEDLPKLLTRHYAQIVSMRLGGEEQSSQEDGWTLERIADTYELVVSINNDPSIRRSSAFVAASAQQLIARREELLKEKIAESENVSRDRLAPEIAAVLLFLAAEQYADALEAASKVKIEKEGQHYLVTELVRHIVDLAKGQLTDIVNRGNERVGLVVEQGSNVEFSAFIALVQSLVLGIENLSKVILGIGLDNTQIQPSIAIFEHVKSLAASINKDTLVCGVEFTFPGITHLASLLTATYDGISESALTRLEPPQGSVPEFWHNWIAFRAKKFPYIWPNHRKALAAGFHHNGTSAVMVLPTGAGKTTISSIKIASTLSQGKKVIFLAPTHALVEQLTVDLQEMFPQDILGSTVSSDFDLLLQVSAVLPEIEVMTPERCLAMLSFSPESFDDVGLLVFDECHLLSPQSGKIRRSLDSMLCLLAFNSIAPEADTLFLSAMVQNGEEFAKWINQLTGRSCISIDLLWKPSRQARGIVIYAENDIKSINVNAKNVQKRLDEKDGRRAANLRAASSRELVISPYAIWGLQHNWLDLENNNAICTFTKLTQDKVLLSGKLYLNNISITPNVNSVAAILAVTSASSRLKTIVFVNQKSHAISTAKSISNELGTHIVPTEDENRRWDALELELGGLEHSLLSKGAAAVPHNASMLRIERELSERMYKRADGAMVIVATPTLAQGLNLPAQMAILAGDKRAENDKRQLLEAHELLNAAARAGRAGHLANGIVLLVPEPVLIFPENQSLNKDVVSKLQSLIPEDDRCVEISDPISIVLDKISNGNTVDRDVMYFVNRLATLNDSENNERSLFNLKSSFAAFRYRTNNEEQRFDTQLVELENLVKLIDSDEIDQSLSILASQSGLPPLVLSRLRTVITHNIGDLPTSIKEWVSWLFDWFKVDSESKELLLFDVKMSVLGATGRNNNDNLSDDVLDALSLGIFSWLDGSPLKNVEIALGGRPDSNNATAKACPRARELIGTILPRGLSFIMGLVTRVVTEINPYDSQNSLSHEVVEALSTAIRLGYDSPEKLAFSIANPAILSRVGVHQAFIQESS